MVIRISLHLSPLQETETQLENKEASVIHAQQEQTRLKQELETEKALLKNCQKENEELKTTLKVVANFW